MKTNDRIRHPLSALLLVCVAGVTLQAGSRAAPAPLGDEGNLEKIDFEGLAESFREANCGKNNEGCTLDSILASAYASMQLGAFDVRYPVRFLEDKKHAERFPQILGCLIDAQLVLARWLADEEDVATLEQDLLVLEQWIDTWRPAQLAKIGRAEDSDLLLALEAPPEVAEAAKRFSSFMRDGKALGVTPQLGGSAEVIFCPTRRDFIEVVAMAGMEDEAFRESTWKEGIDMWTQVWRKWTLVMALEYAPWDGFDKKFSRGMDMDRIDKTGLLQMVTQQCAFGLIYNFFSRPEPWHVEDGLARNMVISVCGKINTIDNERGITTTGGSSQPYSRFVPGGNPAGGFMGALPAAGAGLFEDNQWRKGHGADHFLKPLQRGQKAGGNVAKKDRTNPLHKDKTAHFLLESDKGSKRPVSAPFLGPYAAENQYPPEEFMYDYRQFFQSYMTAFLYWLREHGAGEEGASQEKYAQLIRGMAALRLNGNDFDGLVEGIYGIPISARNGDVDNLEWRFLSWLSES